VGEDYQADFPSFFFLGGMVPSKYPLVLFRVASCLSFLAQLLAAPSGGFIAPNPSIHRTLRDEAAQRR
jgi:hypothetical protein